MSTRECAHAWTIYKKFDRLQQIFDKKTGAMTVGEKIGEMWVMLCIKCGELKNHVI